MCENPFLRTRYFLIVKSAFVFFLLFASAMVYGKEDMVKDTVFLKNGEIVIGDIKELHLGMLTFDSDDVGLINLKIYKIKTINSSSDTLRIETADKAIYFGALKPSEKSGWVYIVTTTQRHLININNINTLLSFANHFWENLAGSVSAGFSYSRSSGIGQLNASFTIGYTAKRYELSMTGSGIASIDTAQFSRDREDVEIKLLYNVRKVWYALAALDYQRNLQLSIARRFQQTAAAGYKVVFSQSFQIMGVGGVSVSQERSTDGVDENFLCEVPLGFSLDYFRFSHPNMQISSDHVFYTGLTQWGRVRYDSNTTFAWELFKDFSVSLSLYLNYDNRPPDSGTEKTDYGTVIGLSYKF